jgi:DMSO/TMAO reductase YedYZ molybdopterin-dependent catalytic subunit
MEPVALEGFTLAELGLAARNHGLPLEALRLERTPPGLHYVLSHFDMPAVDVSSYKLEVGGLVETRLSLSLDELRARPAQEIEVTMECAGNGRALVDPRPRTMPWIDGAVGTARWRGAPLAPLLEEAGLAPTAVEIVFTGLDRGIEGGVEQHFARSLPVEDALEAGALLAYELDGAPLPPQHGFPVRLVVPGWYGMANVKWLRGITAVAAPFDGYYQVQAYCLRAEPDDPGEQLTRMLPRALMAPPGFPEFPSGRRFVDAGGCLLEGRAWSGWAPIVAVDVSDDDGRTWRAAGVEPATGVGRWQAWRLAWTPERAGEFVLRCRARDAAGREQPLEPVWNVGGYANNAAQAVPVVVRDS